MKYAFLSSVLFFVAILTIFTYASSYAADAGDSAADHIPNDSVGPVGNVDGSYKFDDGFYEKISEMVNAVPQDGAPNVHDGKIYHDVIFVISRDDGDDRDPDQTSAENKAALAKRLDGMGAQNVQPAKLLSFVTASVPVTELPGLSLRDEVVGLGDGALGVILHADMARMTIRAMPDDLRAGTSGTVLNGSGVTVGIIDSGIKHTTAFRDKISQRAVCTDSVCSPTITASILPNTETYSFSTTSHGTRVAQVLAASELPRHNGIAPGVSLLDTYAYNVRAIEAAHALDWLLVNGADVVNMSLSFADSRDNTLCASVDSTINDLIINEAVDKGLTVVTVSGNSADFSSVAPVQYKSITSPGCSYNVITVGGIDDRNPDDIMMYPNSSRGPIDNGEIRLKPDLVAPAVDIQTLTYADRTVTHPRNGTSYAAPQVSAATAILLQARPDFTPVEVKAAILLGADWTAPIPCNSPQFEAKNSNDNCSHAVQPRNANTANNAASLNIINNVGFGILNVNQTLEYASERTSSHNHVMRDNLASMTDSKQYTFSVTDTSEPVKIILTWFAHPHGSITDQLKRAEAGIPNLGFTVKPPAGAIINADSKHQTSEFAVFYPTMTGTYTITVTGSGFNNLNKPVQNYAIASTHSLVVLPTSPTNQIPVAHSNTVIIDPKWQDPIAIRLAGTDPDSDHVSFSVSGDPSYGTVSTTEQISKTSSRILYTKNSNFVKSDAFEITPQDGRTIGTGATITIMTESKPSGSKDVPPTSDLVRDWHTKVIDSNFESLLYQGTFTGPAYAVSAIHLGSKNMEGVDARLVTSSGVSYHLAVPSNDTRMIKFASPIVIKSFTLFADGLDEESAYRNTKIKKSLGTSTINSEIAYTDVRMFVGYVPAACAAATVNGGDAISGAQGGSSCPVSSTYYTSSDPALFIPDNTRNQSTFAIMPIQVNGTILDISASVDIEHTYTGDLQVVLISPDGTSVTLHNRTGGSTDNIKKTFDATSVLKPFLNATTAGNWMLVIGDYAAGDVGNLVSWSMSMQYRPQTSSGYSIYVADTDDYEILVYSSTGSYIDDIVSRKSGGLGKPFDVVFGPATNGHLYVSDNTHEKIRRYNATTGAPMGKTVASAEWASTLGVPNGMTWKDNTLYVATLRGVEKISDSGSNLGYFGDASRTPATSGAPALVSPYDVEFCPDGHMYVADLSLNKILYYDGITGKYKGTISDTPSSTQPNMKRASGLECGPAIAASSGTSLFQSGDDNGRVNEVNYLTKELVHQYSMFIDEPHGIDSDAVGNLYVANRDDDNILMISPGGVTTVFATGSLDDPRGVRVGPLYVSTSALPTVSISVSGSTTITEGARATFTISATPTPTSPLAVMVRVNQQGAYTTDTGSKTVTIPTSGSVSLPISTTNDNTDESNGSVTATILSGSDYVVSDTSSRAIVTVNDNDVTPPPPPQPTVSISVSGSATITEGARATFTISATPTPTSPLAVMVRVNQQGAYTTDTGSKTVTIPTSGSVSLPISTTNDNTDESNGSVTATILSGSGYVVSSTAAYATVTVNDNDVAPPSSQPTVSISTSSSPIIIEGNVARFALTASPPPSTPLNVSLQIRERGDYLYYKFDTISFIIPTGGLRFLHLQTVDDRNVEVHGRVNVTILAGPGYTVSSVNDSARVSIWDNELGVPLFNPPSKPPQPDIIPDGKNDEPEQYDNDSPEIILKNNTGFVNFYLDMMQNSTVTLDVTATDPDNDPITFGTLAHSIPSEAVLLSDRGNGTATLSINSATLKPGTYAFVIEAYDGHNLEREICTVVVR